MKPRPYQQKFIDDARFQISKGNRKILCWLGTGSGKGFIIPEIARMSLSMNRKVLFLVHGRGLVLQARDKQFKRLDHFPSVIMGSERGFSKDSNLQIASIDTIRNKISPNSKYDFLASFDLVLIDEAHNCVSPSYQNLFPFFKPSTIFIGFSATPFPINGKVHSFWNVCLNPVSVKELMESGFLLNCKTLVPGIIDSSNVPIDPKTKDFKESFLLELVLDNSIIGGIVEKYRALKDTVQGHIGLPPAILFAVNVEHSKAMAKAFNDAGIPAIHCDANHNKKERQHATEGLKSGLYKVLSNVNLFSTGTDIPCLIVGLMARNTMSEALYIQQSGRLLRPYKICKRCGLERGAELECPTCKSIETSYEIQYALILDFAGNYYRHGDIFKDRSPALDSRYFDRKKLEPKEEVNLCPFCDFVLDGNPAFCPFCKKQLNQKKQSNNLEVKEIDGELVNLDPEFEQRVLIQKMTTRYKQLNTLQKIRRWNSEYVYRLLHKEFGRNVLLVAQNIGVHPNFIEMLEKELAFKLAESAKKVLNDLSYQSEKLIQN